jgi:hypothetical protein
MNRRLFHSVASLLSARPQHKAISAICAADADSLLRWLDFAGLSLYLLDATERGGFSEQLPARLVDELLLRRSHNSERAKIMLEELSAILLILKQAEIPVIVMKGFSLAGNLSPNAFARHQNDLDLLISLTSRRRITDSMTRAGYKLYHGSNDIELIFHATVARQPEDPSVSRIYQACSHAKIEFHHQLWDSISNVELPLDCEPFESSALLMIDGLEIPTLNLRNMFTLHVMHAFRHLIYSGWIRPSWLFEISYSIRRHYDNEVLWRGFSGTLASNQSRQAAGLVLAFVQQYFKAELPLPLRTLADSIQPNHRLWLELCGDAVLFSRIAESKLNLLIFRDFCTSNSSAKQHEDEAIGFVSKYLCSKTLPSSYKDKSLVRWIPYIGKRMFEHVTLNLEVRRYRRTYGRALLRNSRKPSS